MSKVPDVYTKINNIANRLEKEMESVIQCDTPTVISLLVETKSLDENIKYLKSRSAELYKRMKEEIVPKKFEEQGVSSITIDNYRYTVSHQARTSLLPDYKEEAKSWLRDNGLGDIITETVNASTLSATAKSLAEEGMDMPDNLFRTYTFENTSVTKVK